MEKELERLSEKVTEINRDRKNTQVGHFALFPFALVLTFTLISSYTLGKC